jgi:muramoyltetrapeptide carboxypeptidase
MLKPRALKPGDRIAVVSPASPFDRDEFDAGLGELRALGFEPVHDARVFARRGYVSGEARLRADAFMDAWRDPAIAGVVAVRGGYGSVQLLPLLDPAELRQTPKVFVGYSDLTSMLVFLGNCGIVSFHGPMLAGKLGRGDEGYDRASFLAAVTGTAPLGAMRPAGLETLHAGTARGPLVGGTLSQVLASLATPYAFDPPAGCLLFIDEVGERPYRLDRMLTQLRLAGLLDRAAGIVFGQMPRCDEPRGDPRARSVVQDLLAGFRGPVLYGFPSGHTTTPAMTLPLGIEAAIVADDDPRLVIEEAAVT